MKNKFTKSAKNALQNALNIAKELGHSYIGTEHILLGILFEDECTASKMLEKSGVNFTKTRDIVVEISGIFENSTLTVSDMTPAVKKVIEASSYIAVRYGQEYIGTEHLLLAIADDAECVANKLLVAQNINISDLISDISYFFQTGSNNRSNEYKSKTVKSVASPLSQSAPNILQYGRDLVNLAKLGKIDPIIGRENETMRIIQILSRRTKNNPCLIGEPGVGKTAVIEGLAQKIAQGNVPEILKDKIIVSMDVSAMIAGAKYRGEFEERLKKVMEEIAKNPQIIMFIDEIHIIIGAGAAEGAVDAANILKPAMSRGEIQLIGATTLNEYRKYIEKDAALERRFQPVQVGEPTNEETYKILFGLRDKYEAHHKIKITDDAIYAAVNLSKRYIPDKFLPDKAIDLIDEAASKKRIDNFILPENIKNLQNELNSLSNEKEDAVRMQNFEKAASFRDKIESLKVELEKEKNEWENKRDSANLYIDGENIAEILTEQTAIPIKKLEGEENLRLNQLEKLLCEKIIGQDEAVKSVARAVKRARVGLKDPNRPSGSFIFLGPTGVGKTELAKRLCEILFGDEKSIIRVDMSEYMEKHSVSKLIGSPPGYVGYDDGNHLAEKVRRKPYCVILFDEIEKAHPDVMNILLQILEDGSLTDSQGKKIDFKNTVLIMTSNLGAQSISEQKTLGFNSNDIKNDAKQMKSAVYTALKGFLKPEFINRVDEIIIFSRLGIGDIEKIAEILLKGVKSRLENQNIHIDFDKSVVEYIAKNGYDQSFGARPLRRIIQRKIEDWLSEKILQGDLAIGDSGVLHIENDEIVLKKSTANTPIIQSI